jgi:hypothetical protein
MILLGSILLTILKTASLSSSDNFGQASSKMANSGCFSSTCNRFRNRSRSSIAVSCCFTVSCGFVPPDSGYIDAALWCEVRGVRCERLSPRLRGLLASCSAAVLPYSASSSKAVLPVGWALAHAGIDFGSDGGIRIAMLSIPANPHARCCRVAFSRDNPRSCVA